MRTSCFLRLFILCFSVGAPTLALSQIVFPDQIDLKIAVDPDNPQFAKGTAYFKLSSGRFCVIQPLNKPRSTEHHHPIKSLDLFYQRTAKTHRLDGEFNILGFSENARRLRSFSSSVEEFSKTDSKSLRIDFDMSLPVEAFSKVNELIFYNYVPYISKDCKSDAASTANTHKSSFQITVESPSDWMVLSPFVTQVQTMPNNKNVTSLTGGHANFAAGQGYKKASDTTSYANINLYYRTDEFKEHLSTIKFAFDFLSKRLTHLPIKNFIVFESTYSTQANILGLIAFQKPRQELLKSLQEYWLNWADWATTAAVANQWFGTILKTEKAKDDWLIDSLRDYFVGKTLQADKHNYNLFDGYKHALFGFKFTYGEFQDLTAANLNSSTPKAILTDKNFQTKDRYNAQNPLLFIRNVMALRSLEVLLGGLEMQKIVANMMKKTTGPESTTPQKFVSHVLREVRQRKQALTGTVERVLQEWWTKNGWPDRSIEDFKVTEREDGKRIVTMSIEEKGRVQTPTDIYVYDKKGQQYVISGSSQQIVGGFSTQTLVIDHEFSHINIDPNMDVFDHNRFNNRTDWADAYFFPGNAKQLYQDAYTIFWFPYFSKRPGEDVRFGLQSVILKYLRGDYAFWIETSPKDSNTTYQISHQQTTNFPGLKYTLSVSRDFRGQHVGFIRGELSNVNSSSVLPLTLYSLAKIKQEGQDDRSRHGTLGLGFFITPNYRPDPCDFTMNSEIERTPSEQGERKIDYERTLGFARVRCNLSKQTSISLRVFRGVNRIYGTAPLNTSFWPQNLDEARVRIDVPIGEPSRSINSIGGDLFFPFVFPFDVNSYILTKKMKMKLFYDYAETENTSLRAAGVGLILPVGGDVSGVGQVSVTRFSVLGVLYQAVDDDVADQAILFDITGKI